MNKPPENNRPAIERNAGNVPDMTGRKRKDKLRPGKRRLESTDGEYDAALDAVWLSGLVGVNDAIGYTCKPGKTSFNVRERIAREHTYKLDWEAARFHNRRIHGVYVELDERPAGEFPDAVTFHAPAVVAPAFKLYRNRVSMKKNLMRHKPVCKS